MTKTPDMNSIIDTDDDPKDSITNKSKVWRWINKEKQKLVIIATIIGSIGVIWTYVGPIVSDIVISAKSGKHRMDTLSISSKKHEDLIKVLISEVDSLKKNKSGIKNPKDSLTIDSLRDASNLYRYHLLLLNDIISPYLENTSIDGVNFKKSKSGKLYYSVNGVLYNTVKYNGQYYYVDYKGKYYTTF